MSEHEKNFCVFTPLTFFFSSIVFNQISDASNVEHIIQLYMFNILQKVIFFLLMFPMEFSSFLKMYLTHFVVAFPLIFPDKRGSPIQASDPRRDATRVTKRPETVMSFDFSFVKREAKGQTKP